MPAPASDPDSPARAGGQPRTRLVAVAHPRDDIEAQLVKNLLADAGVEATVTGASLAGFRAETPADVCVMVRAGDAEAAKEALAAVRPEIDDSLVGDETPLEPEAPVRRPFEAIFPAAIALGIVTTLVSLGWWLADLPGLEASPIDFLFAFGTIAALWLLWRKRR